MRTRLPASLLASVALVATAHADTYQFTFDGVYTPNPNGPVIGPINGSDTLNLAFDLTGFPDAFIIADSGYGIHYYSNVGKMGLNIEPDDSEVLYFLSFANYADSDFEYAYLETVTPIFTGGMDDPIFLPGSYKALYSYQDYSNYDGTLTITDATMTTTTATPEPSTFALLGAGLLGVAGMMRRRL